MDCCNVNNSICKMFQKIEQIGIKSTKKSIKIHGTINNEKAIVKFKITGKYKIIIENKDGSLTIRKLTINKNVYDRYINDFKKIYNCVVK